MDMLSLRRLKDINMEGEVHIEGEVDMSGAWREDQIGI